MPSLVSAASASWLRRSAILPFISAAAARVNVSTSRLSTGAPARMRETIRSVSTAVLPAPAAAETIRFPSLSIASS